MPAWAARRSSSSGRPHSRRTAPAHRRSSRPSWPSRCRRRNKLNGTPIAGPEAVGPAERSRWPARFCPKPGGRARQGESEAFWGLPAGCLPDATSTPRTPRLRRSVRRFLSRAWLRTSEPGTRVVAVLVLHHDDFLAIGAGRRRGFAVAHQRPARYPTEGPYGPVRGDRIGGGQCDHRVRAAVVGDVEVVFEEGELGYRELFRVVPVLQQVPLLVAQVPHPEAELRSVRVAAVDQKLSIRPTGNRPPP